MPNLISKSYNSIKELPSEVRSSFDERDQKKWMDAYNEASQNEDPDKAKVDAWMSMVDAPSSLAVETWGSVEVRDADGELVPIETIAENADKFIMNGGLMHDSHSNVPMGTVWDWEIRKHPETGKDGIVFYFNVYRDGEVFERARDDILSGRKNAVSIGAEAPRGGYKCDDRGCYVERDVTDLYELSICETPANPEAYFINVGKDIAKAKKPIKGEMFRVGIQDYIVHQDYTTCPLQKCKHDLLEKGFTNVHLTKKGYIIAKSKNEFKLLKTIEKMGFPFRYDLKKEQFEIMPDYGVEQAIEEAVGNGWAHEDQIGHVCLTKEIPKEVFMDWYDRGFITKIGDFYCLKADDVAKDGGAMGVGDAGASNPVYGAKPTSLTNPDKKYGKKRKAKKELYDEGNTHGPAPSKIPKMKKSWNSIQKRCPKGTWKDEKTGECIPIDEWKSKYGGKDKTNESKEKPEKDAPKEEPSKGESNVNTAKDLNSQLDKFRKKHNLKCEVGMSNGTIAIRVDSTTRRSTMSKYLEFIKDFAEKNNLQIDPTGGNYYLRLGSKEDIENNHKILQEKRAKESEERKKQKESRKAEWEKKESEKSDAWKSAELDGAIQLIESIGNARENFYAIKVPNLEIEARFFKDNFSKDSKEEEADEFRGKETPPIPNMKSGLSSSSDSLVIDEDSYVAYDDDKDRAYAYDKKKKKWAVIQNFSRYLDGDIEDILKDESTVMP